MINFSIIYYKCGYEDLYGIFSILAIIIILLGSNITIVPQANNYVVERLGAYSTTWETGLHFKIPIIDRVAKRISVKEQL